MITEYTLFPVFIYFELHLVTQKKLEERQKEGREMRKRNRKKNRERGRKGERGREGGQGGKKEGGCVIEIPGEGEK